MDCRKEACTTVAEVASGNVAMHKLHSRDSAHDLAVKISPCVCSHSSCLTISRQSQILLLFMVCVNQQLYVEWGSTNTAGTSMFKISHIHKV